jgi:hypothetical protein
MQSITPLIIVGLFVYLMFSRKGGMGCCGGHSGHDSKRHQDNHTGTPTGDPMGTVIDLKEEDYIVLQPSENPINRRLPR